MLSTIPASDIKYTESGLSRQLEEETLKITESIADFVGHTTHSDRIIGGQRNLRLSRMAYYSDHKDANQHVNEMIQSFFADKTWIVGVACQLRDNNRVFDLIGPSRHHHVLQLMHHSGVKCCHSEISQGFLCYEKGKRFFVDRLQAMDIAESNGQLRRLVGKQYYQGPELYSEDLW